MTSTALSYFAQELKEKGILIKKCAHFLFYITFMCYKRNGILEGIVLSNGKTVKTVLFFCNAGMM